jgi:SAM-dependent methyltransferase
MQGYGPHSYGDHFADVYDDWYSDVSDVDATVTRVASLAAGLPVLELGVGTGRLAIPLARLGLDVIGVDASALMIERLSAKEGGDMVRTLVADMADLPVDDGHFGIAFAAFNTFFNLTDGDDQARCVGRVHEVLTPGGVFAIEGFVPPVEGLTDGGISVRSLTVDRVVLSVSRHDPGDQIIEGQHVDITTDGIALRPWVMHYRTPDQLDELLQAGGFDLESRWADWTGTSFGPESEAQVSVYRRVG